jgi:hypothetical protein
LYDVNVGSEVVESVQRSVTFRDWLSEDVEGYVGPWNVRERPFGDDKAEY